MAGSECRKRAKIRNLSWDMKSIVKSKRVLYPINEPLLSSKACMTETEQPDTLTNLSLAEMTERRREAPAKKLPGTPLVRRHRYILNRTRVSSFQKRTDIRRERPTTSNSNEYMSLAAIWDEMSSIPQMKM